MVAAVLASVSLTSFAAEKSGEKVVYGNDDRQDSYQVADNRMLQLADSTVGLVRSRKISLDATGQNAVLATGSYRLEYSLCAEEPFVDQETLAFCSGSLVGPDLILTAGHCVTTQADCEGTSFVFGFAVETAGVNPRQVPASEVHSCAKLLSRVYEPRGADYALIQLTRPVLNHVPLALNRSGAITNGTPLVVIGHPAGLPRKVAGGANVRDASPTGYFVANLDTYGGNSGSAVFNALTGQIEGVLVRGETDYVMKPGAGCRISNKCPDSGCRGEDVTKVASFASLVP